MLAFAAAAQVGPPLTDSAWVAAVTKLKPGDSLRIRTGESRIEARLIAATGPRLTVSSPSGTADYSTASIDSLWVRGTSARKGAIIGGISLAAAGAAFGIFVNGVACQPDGDPCPEAIPVLGLAGAAAGALLGALIGSAIPRWHLRVP